MSSFYINVPSFSNLVARAGQSLREPFPQTWFMLQQLIFLKRVTVYI